MFKFYFNKRILVGFLLTLTILSWLAIASFINTTQLIESSRMTAHTLDVLYHTQRVLAISTNMEIGQRGYSLTGNEAFLEPYSAAREEINLHLQELKDLTRNTPHEGRAKTLETAIQKLMAFSANAVEARRRNFEAARDLNASLEGKRLMDVIRRTCGDIEAEENVALKTWNSISHDRMSKFNYAFVSLITVTGVILIVIFLTINYNLRSRIDSENRLALAYDEIRDLYDNAPCGYHSLNEAGVFVEINKTLLQWLGYQKEEIIGKMRFQDVLTETSVPVFEKSFDEFKKKGSVYNLEFHFLRKDGSSFPVILNAIAIKDENGKYIKSRSNTFDNTQRKQAETKVQSLNKELEAFTYSVSHDLRAPLRSIDGYTRILKEDYAHKLDEEGNRVLTIVISNANRMGKLIDDLLDFARLGRKEVQNAKLNMTQLVNTVTQELLTYENRKINVKIGDLAASHGDLDMMRQVWENLMSNAIKYTGKTDNAVIEVSSFENDNEVGYSIRDNGVGFDMRYAPKLFGVFQRLHKMQDFSGTGVGLAIVKRIIDRHHGRVWAEGKINNGATFYFTIPNSNGKQ